MTELRWQLLDFALRGIDGTSVYILAITSGDEGLQSHRILRLGHRSAFFLSGWESAMKFSGGGINGARSVFGAFVGAVDMERRKQLGTTSRANFRASNRRVENILRINDEARVFHLRLPGEMGLWIEDWDSGSGNSGSEESGSWK